MNQKDHERICVERFLEAIGKVPTLIEDSEAPDFRVTFGDEVVGIEVTEASFRAGERGKNTPGPGEPACASDEPARDLYDATGAPPLHVSAGFLDHTLARKEKKLASYRYAVGTVWLVVVVASSLKPAKSSAPPEPPAPFSIATAFDRVFAFHWLTGRVSEIPILRAERSANRPTRLAARVAAELLQFL